MVCAGKGLLSHLMDSFQAEVVACLQGVQVAIDLGIFLEEKSEGFAPLQHNELNKRRSNRGTVSYYRNENAKAGARARAMT